MFPDPVCLLRSKTTLMEVIQTAYDCALNCSVQGLREEHALLAASIADCVRQRMHTSKMATESNRVRHQKT